MRTRKEIEADNETATDWSRVRKNEPPEVMRGERASLRLEVLLDIRDLLSTLVEIAEEKR